MATLSKRRATQVRTGNGPAVRGPARLLRYLPRGNMLDDDTWQRRHHLLRWLLFLHAPGLMLFGLWRGFSLLTCAAVVGPLFACLGLAAIVTRHRLSSFFVTAGLVYCSSALVGLSGGAIEAHFHFFIIIGFIALYQDWVPFLWNIVFTVISHGLGSAWSSTLIFDHPSGQQNPWIWSLIHGVAVLAACAGMVIFWRYSEDEQERTIALRTHIAQAEIERRRFTSDLLVNLARRNQAMLHRQLSILNHLEEKEHDPDALTDLFQLDHLANRIRRNAESLLVLSGEDPPRVWAEPVRLVDVVRAAIAETENLDRVIFEVDENLAVLGHTVTGVTHLLAELLENAVRYSDPTTNVMVRVRADPRAAGTQVLTVEDWGVGMPPDSLAAANEILSNPPDVDLATSRRYGLHVVSRLAQRHGVQVRLSTTGFAGLTAAVVLPPALFVPTLDPRALSAAAPDGERVGHRPRRALQAPREAALALADHPLAASSNGWGAPAPQHEDGGLTPGRGVEQWPGWWDRDQYPGAGLTPPTPPMPSRPSTPPMSSTPPMPPSGPPVPSLPAVRAASAMPSMARGSVPLSPRAASAPPPGRPDVPDGDSPAADVIDLTGPQLSQRVPQRNLSPHLRRGGAGPGAGPTGGPSGGPSGDSTPDARQAADALSRYQASRQAALRAVSTPRPDIAQQEGQEW